MAVSIPDLREPRLNLPHLREGRLPERARTDEVTVNEAFAKAHRMQIGSTFKALLNGKKRELKWSAWRCRRSSSTRWGRAT